MAKRKARQPKKAATSQIRSNGEAEPQKVGRPTDYTPEIGARICAMVAQRIPVVDICEMDGMPVRSTLYLWKRVHKEFSDDFMRAREERADARQDYIDEIAKDLKAGKIDAATARVLIDAEKWQMGKEKPKSYGDKVALTDPDGGVLTVRFAA